MSAAISIPDCCKKYTISRSTLYDIIRRGEIPVRKVGRRSIISVEDAEKWFESLPVGTDPGVLGRGLKS
jgi:excisionase family DNA binding protein